METTAQVESPEVKAIKLESMLSNLARHQSRDQQRLDLLETAVRTLAVLPQQMHTVEHLIANMEMKEVEVAKSKREWITSDAVLDDTLSIAISGEMKEALQSMADKLGVSGGCLLRQFIVRAIPSLHELAGPKMNAAQEQAARNAVLKRKEKA